MSYIRKTNTNLGDLNIMIRINKSAILIILVIVLLNMPSTFSYSNCANENNSSLKIFEKTIDFFQNSVAPSELVPGDLVFCEVKDNLVKYFKAHDVESGFDHIAMYIGKKFGMDFVIEATYIPTPKVKYTPLIILKLYGSLTFGKVTAADEVTRDGALNFAKSQLGRPYQHISNLPENDPFRWHANSDPDDTVDPYSDWWYCAELIWASYYNQGIDLDTIYPENRDNNYVDGYGYLRFVSPQNIFNSANSSKLPLLQEQICELPSWVRRGDILFLDCKGETLQNLWDRPGNCNDHVALYLGKGYLESEWPFKFVYDPSGEDMFIESLGCENRKNPPSKKHVDMRHPNGVQINNYSFYFSWGKSFRFGTVITDDSCVISEVRRENALTFALSMYDTAMRKYHKYNNETGLWSDGNYQVFFSIPYFGVKHNNPNATWGFKGKQHPTANKWFCAEFVWAAYMNCDDPYTYSGKGIDIDCNEWRNLDDYFFYKIWYGAFRWMTPQEILWDDNILLSPIMYTLDIQTDPSDADVSILREPNQGTYFKNDIVNVTAVSGDNVTFSHWSGDIISSDNPLTINIDGNVKLVANCFYN